MVENYFAVGWKPPWESLGGLYLQYAEVYKDAVELLIKDLKDVAGHSYKPLPVMFLFRHYLELQLTGLIAYGAYFSHNLGKGLSRFLEEKRKSHNLMRLLNKLSTYEKSIKWPKGFSEFITNFDKFDRLSDRFRYPENRQGESYFKEIVHDKKFLFIINRASELANYVKIVIDNLEGLEAYFEIAKENYEENLKINAEMNAEYADHS